MNTAAPSRPSGRGGDALGAVRRSSLVARRVDSEPSVGMSTMTIHGVPKRSVHMPNAGEKKLSPSGTWTCPLSDSASNTRRSSATSGREQLTHIPSTLPSKWPDGSSAPIRSSSPAVSAACMIASALAQGGGGPASAGASAMVSSTSSPPKISW